MVIDDESFDTQVSKRVRCATATKVESYGEAEWAYEKGMSKTYLIGVLSY